jgi:formylglycine-generating enzyme required for sulfatase activity
MKIALTVYRFPASLIVVLVAGLSGAAVAGQVEAPSKAGSSFRDCFDCPEMVVIPPGEFMMGAKDDDADRALAGPDLVGKSFFMGSVVRRYFDWAKPRHLVTIHNTFALGKYHVAVGEFAAFVRETGYSPGDDCLEYTPGDKNRYQRRGASWRHPGFEQSDRDPVVCVSWQDSTAYIRWLNDKTLPGLSADASRSYHLPSEAEWEYAARGGRETIHWWGEALGSNNATIAFASKTGQLDLTPAGFSGEILGFIIHDTIGLTGVTDALPPSIVNGDTLVIPRAVHSPIVLTLDPSQNYTGASFFIGADSSANNFNTVTTNFGAACYCGGTRILTDRGEIAADTLDRTPDPRSDTPSGARAGAAHPDPCRCRRRRCAGPRPARVAGPCAAVRRRADPGPATCERRQHRARCSMLQRNILPRRS